MTLSGQSRDAFAGPLGWPDPGEDVYPGLMTDGDRYPYALLGTPSRSHIDFAELASFRFSAGGGFPDSYQAFVRQYGWARTFGFWLVYPPVKKGFADGWQRAKNLTHRFRTGYRGGRTEGFDWMVEPDGDWSLPEVLQVFAWSENGDALLWDTSRPGSNREYPIWESQACDSLRYLGADLREALPKMLDRSRSLFGQEVGSTLTPLPPAHLSNTLSGGW